MSGNTLLLLHGETLVDSSGHNRTITNNGVTLSASQSKFGNTSLYFNGSSYLQIPLVVSGDITIDFWVYTTSFNASYPTPVDFAQASERGITLHLASSTAYLCGKKVSDLTTQTLATYAAVPAGAWHHVAITRQGTTLKAYTDGVLKATVTDTGANLTRVFIGCDEEKVEFFTGYIDEFRISNTVRWTADFTPPSEPYIGSPTAPAGEHNTLINGVSYQIEAGTTLVGGASRKIKSGLALIGGVQREIIFAATEFMVGVSGVTPNKTYYYAKIDGTVLSIGAVEVDGGTAITCGCSDSSGYNLGEIYLNGGLVASGSRTLTYTMPVESNVSVLLWTDTRTNGTYWGKVYIKTFDNVSDNYTVTIANQLRGVSVTINGTTHTAAGSIVVKSGTVITITSTDRVTVDGVAQYRNDYRSIQYTVVSDVTVSTTSYGYAVLTTG